MDTNWRRLLAVVALGTLAASATPDPTYIEDTCGGGLLTRSDICLITIDPDFASPGSPEEEPGLSSVEVRVSMNSSVEEWRPNELVEVNFELGNCFWSLRWHHDPGLDLPQERSTRLDRRCDGAFEGLELGPTIIDGRDYVAVLTPDDFGALGATVRTGTTLIALHARSYVGVGTSAVAFTQVSYNLDETDRHDVTLSSSHP